MRAVELLEIFSSANYALSYAYAKATNTCIRCGMPAEAFKDASTRMEYMISVLCEDCQSDIIDQR